MIVRTAKDLQGTDREVHAPTWVSRRFLLRKDGMGFSFHETIIYAGTETYMWYRNHLESVYCVEGEGELEDLANGDKHTIVPGTMYALDQHDKHIVRAKTNLRLMCVFNPPCTGKEVHDDEGVYPLIEDEENDSVAAKPLAATEH
ncbi:MAG: L-ectoine synthase [Candidatus Hydrogenedentota bacterium]